MSAKISIYALIVLLALGLLCSPALADVGSPPGGLQKAVKIQGEANIVSMRLNNTGWRVGYFPNSDAELGMMWTPAGCRALPPLGGFYSCANDVNDAGLIVGQTDTAKVDRGGRIVRQAFIWRDEQMMNIDHARSFSDSSATGVNRDGWVVGWISNESGDRHAALWTFREFTHQGPAIIDLGTIGGQNSEATAVNRYGLVVGFSETEILVPGNPHTLAFRYEYPMEVGMTPLPELVVGRDCAALDVNDLGSIVGWAQDASNNRHAVMWQYGALKELGGFGGTDGVANAINNAGLVVGLATVPIPPNIPPGCFAPVERAFVWKTGVMTDLNTLLPPDSGWLLTEARDINDRNEVTGTAWRNGELWSFVLTLPRELSNVGPKKRPQIETEVAGGAEVK